MHSTVVFRLCLGLLFAATTCDAVHAIPLPPECTPLLNSNTGCDFYAVTLPNTFLDQSTFSFGVDVLNSGTASVSVFISGGGLVSPVNFNVNAGASVTQLLPWVSTISTATATSKIAGGAYHITTALPVSVLQLNPATFVVASTYSYSNDASLLLPVKSAGTAYRVVTWPTWNSLGGQYPGHVAVVGTAAGTSVTIAAQVPGIS